MPEPLSTPSGDKSNQTNIENENLREQVQAVDESQPKAFESGISKADVLKMGEQGMPVAFAVGRMRTASELLENLSLPNECIQVLHPALAQIGLNLEIQARIDDKEIKRTHFVTVIHNNRDYRCIIFIPPEVTADPDGDILLALKNLIELMLNYYQKRMKLFVVYELTLDASYKKYLNVRVVRSSGLEINYIQNSEFRDMRDWPLEDQLDYLKDILSLNELIQSGRGGPQVPSPAEAEAGAQAVQTSGYSSKSGQLSYRDLRNNAEKINRIVEIFSGQAEYAPSSLGARGYLRGKINETQWPEPWKNSRISGLTSNAETDARELVTFALRQGTLQGKAGLTALGSLLQTILEDLGEDEFEEIRAIIRDYNLVS